MQLRITKGQSKGMLGGVTFEVKAKVHLTPEEQKLVDHYNLSSEVLIRRKLTIFGIETDQTVEVTVRSLLQGDAFKAKNLGEVQAYSDAVKNACERLKTHLEVARNFGGEESYDF